jgi:hypothetical protein
MRSRYSYDRRDSRLRLAGGIDLLPGEDAIALLKGFPLEGLRSKDIALATYLFDTSAGEHPGIADFRDKLAEEYASRFADWLGYVFLNRANKTQSSKAMKALEDALGDWVESLPNMLSGRPEPLTKSIPEEAARFLVLDKIDAIGEKIFKVVRMEYMKAGSGERNANLEALPITYDRGRAEYVIPKSALTFANRAKLRDLGFDFDGAVWHTKTLDQRALDELPSAGAAIQRGTVKPVTPSLDAHDWFFNEWLPSNISRFSKIFTDFGRGQGVPYEFKFVVQGDDVTVNFERNITTVAAAIQELRARYGKAGDREGWMGAVECYDMLKRAHGRAAIAAVDRANDLQHSHGSMIEHFPPDVRDWYPAFLDFKFSASQIQIARSIQDQDLKELALAIVTTPDPKDRYRPSQTDTRTVRGLAMEVAAQPGKAGKKKRLQITRKLYPDMYDDVVKELESRGLSLT